MVCPVNGVDERCLTGYLLYASQFTPLSADNYSRRCVFVCLFNLLAVSPLVARVTTAVRSRFLRLVI